jgi:hypothetical protein
LSVGFWAADADDDLLREEDLENIWTWEKSGQLTGEAEEGTKGGEGHTSNCQRSRCSPVSLLVMTTTSLDILPPIIHSLS